MIKFFPAKRKNVTTGEVKYYPSVADTTPVTLREISAEIEKYCTLSDSDVSAVILALEETVATLLKQGHSVRLGTLGSFRPTLAQKGSKASEDEVKASDVKLVRCRFTASSALKQALAVNGLNFKKVEGNGGGE